MSPLEPFVVSEFRPAWWLPGPHLQTVGARWLRTQGGLSLQRERIELPDGDFVDLDFALCAPRADDDDRRPLVLLVHGLEGSARSGYAFEAYRALGLRGLAAVGLNFRSCSGEMNRLPRLYHSGETEDLRYVLCLLAGRYPRRPRGVIGFSLGGNVVLKYLGESAERARGDVAAAVAISVPFDLSAGADHMRRRGGRLYARVLLRSLCRKVRAKRGILPLGMDVRAALAAESFREFDDAVTAPLHGFSGAEDYYRQSSSARVLDRIRVPTLLLQSADDPFFPGEQIPRSAVRSNPHLQAGFTDRGGHVGFVMGTTPFRPVFWAEREAARFLHRRLLEVPDP